MSANDNPQSLMLSPNDLVGVIRQGLGELQGYLSQPLPAIDSSVVVAYLERMAGFAQHLLAAQQALSKGAPAEGKPLDRSAEGKSDQTLARKN